jgi:hypothetical protein
MTIRTMTVLERIIAFGDGRLSRRETIALIQELVNAGIVASLPEDYSDTARAMTANGLIQPHAEVIPS